MPDQSAVSVPSGFPRPFGPNYVLLKEIGAGGMGRVYMALSGATGMQRLCAIKTLSFADGERDIPGLSRRFVDEAGIATRLSQDNLVYVFDAGIAASQRYLAMDFIGGKTLAQVWARATERGRRFPLGIAMYIAAEVLSALDYIHQFEGMGIVHRDVTPSNVMLGYTGAVKLIDFGIVKWRNRATQTGVGVRWGKAGYLAPEQLRGDAVDCRSDIYAVGVMFWEMLAGRRLRAEDDLRPEIATVPPPSSFHDKVPSELDQVALDATAADPELRFPSAAQFKTSLSRYLPPENLRSFLAEFLAELFDDEIRAEKAEADALVAVGRSLGRVESAVDVARVEADPLIGTILGDRYEIYRVIGRGAMGSVYEGCHRQIGKRVAVKIANPDEKDPELARRLLIEAAAAGQLEHENITGVLDSGTTPKGAFYFVMEFVNGVGLGEIIHREAPLPVERALVIAVQVCKAAAAAHASGVVHRDLKPGNIMLVRVDAETPERVKVLDFGLAKFLKGHARRSAVAGDGLTQPEAVLGTPRYMAPEQFTAAQDAGVAADIYAIGTIVYEMLTGRVPFDSDEPSVICSRKLTEDPMPVGNRRADLSTTVAATIMATLARDPGLRPRSADELVKSFSAELGRIRSTEPMPAAETATASVGTRWPLWTGLGMGAVALAGLGYWLSTRSVATMPKPPVSVVTSPVDTRPAVVAAEPPQALPEPRRDAAAPPDLRHDDIRPVVKPAGHDTAPHRTTEPTTAPKVDGEALARCLDKGEEFFLQGDLLKAVTQARKAISLGGGADAYVLLGKSLLGMGRREEAITAHEHALKLDPSNKAAALGKRAAMAAP